MVILFIVLAISAGVLFNKFRSTKAGWIIRFSWFVFVFFIFFFFFSPNYSEVQNMVMATAGAIGIFYYLYNLIEV